MTDRPYDERFAARHIGPRPEDVDAMLAYIGLDSLDELVDRTVPADIRSRQPLGLGVGLSEAELLETVRRVGDRNRSCRSYIGQGYADCHTPAVIQRNILENPGWYTQYTPYQSEISQGRLEALLNFQTMVVELTAMEIANASLLDEATAAAEAMAMLKALSKNKKADTFVAAPDCHPQTLAVVRHRAQARGLKFCVADPLTDELGPEVFGILLQYPNTYGGIGSYAETVEKLHRQGVLVAVAADLLALTLVRPPGEWGADVVVGSTQRFGMPLGYGGPHAAFFATRASFRRQVPGRIIGVTKDRQGRPAMRMALQTREQHIRRQKATSNICTAQVLPAVVASMYAVYHGPEGLRRIAARIHGLTRSLAAALKAAGLSLRHEHFFDTLSLGMGAADQEAVLQRAAAAGVNLGQRGADGLVIALDETTTGKDVEELVELVVPGQAVAGDEAACAWPDELCRKSPYLDHEVFAIHRSETQIQRYMHRLQARDLSLTTSMIPLGSCTMKLNAAAEMMPITWPQFARIHPYAPVEQAAGYQQIFEELTAMLRAITGFEAVSLQPNAGSQGEYAGLLAIRRYLESIGQGHRRVCLIPASAHGTNPASAVMAGLDVVVVACDASGNIDLDDLSAKTAAHGDNLAALMVTYPSTHGVFEEPIRHICEQIHQSGGQVYMDGANMNAMVGLCRPAEIGVDVCHINLHKTFCIPHGGGGPGMGPIAVAGHLAPFLPRDPLAEDTEGQGIGPVAASNWSSALILVISWAYIRMMGDDLATATKIAILNANYMAQRLDGSFPVLYRGGKGLVAHEAILDLRAFEAVGIRAEDVAKRLMDYGFHAPTVHFPVVGTLMIEPTESEDKAQIDAFCQAMEAIRAEIAAVAEGRLPGDDHPLINAPHTALMVTADQWLHPYSRQEAAFPLASSREAKFWPAVARLDEAGGDRNLVCTCLPPEAYEK